MGCYAPLSERLWRRVDLLAPDGCWLWLGARNSKGYGTIGTIHPKTGVVHRVAWEMIRGPIPVGMQLDHRVCRNKVCVNPDHLVLCTSAENVLQPDGGPGKKKAKTHCVRGHEFTPENTLPSLAGHRRCRACAKWYRKYRYTVNGKQYQLKVSEII